MPALQINIRKPHKRGNHERIALSHEDRNDSKRLKRDSLDTPPLSQQASTYLAENASKVEKREEDHTDSIDWFLANLPASTETSTVVDNWEESGPSDATASNDASGGSYNTKSPGNSRGKLDRITVKHSTFPFKKGLYQPDNSSSPAESVASFQELYDIRVELADSDKSGHDQWSPILDWNEAGLPLPIMKVIKGLHYGPPTPVQAQTLPVIMSGHDLVAIAPTGSGKTAAFLIPMLRHIVGNLDAYRSSHAKGPYAVILVPTRELCIQISSELEPWVTPLGLVLLSSYGGSNIAHQISQLVNNNCHIIVATPGRLIDLLAVNNGRILSLSSVTYLVVDETDRMFDLGFGPQVRKIVETTRPDRQTVVFSATMLPAMEVLVNRILHQPVKVLIGVESKVPTNVTQSVILLKKEEKTNILVSLFPLPPNESAIVFVNTQTQADTLNIKLLSKGIKSQTLHGGMDQRDREDVIHEFKQGQLPVLVATSVAARGLDVRHLTLVVNYDAASHLEDYVHRAGRTGRAGDKGRCITFLEPDQTREAFQISKSLRLDDETIIKMAKSYAATAEQSANNRWGFGGHGLAKLENKWNLQRSVELGAYVGSPGETMIEDNDFEILQQGSSYVARLVVNDAPKEARIAVTSVATQNEVIEKYHVALTLKGIYTPNPKPTMPKESKLHLHIESSSKQEVTNAYHELRRVLITKTAEANSVGKYSAF